MYKDIAILLLLQPVDSLRGGKSALAIKSAHLAAQEARVDRTSGDPIKEVALWYSNHRRTFFHHLAAYFA